MKDLKKEIMNILCRRYNYLNIDIEDIISYFNDNNIEVNVINIDRYCHSIMYNNIKNGDLTFLVSYLKNKIDNDYAIDNILTSFDDLHTILSQLSIKFDDELFLELVFSDKYVEEIVNKVVSICDNFSIFTVSKNVKTLFENYRATKKMEDGLFDDEYSYDVSEDDSVGNVDYSSYYLKEISKFKLLTKEEEYFLASKYIETKDKKYKDKLVESNLRLVVSIAKKYVGRGLSLTDLIQNGSLGLMTAIDKFDPEKGYKLSTYATHWISQAISRSISDTSRNIRIPVHVHEKINQYRRQVKELAIRLKREPSYNDIKRELGVTDEFLMLVDKYGSDTISINTKVDEDGDSELGDMLSADTETPEDNSLTAEQLQHINSVVDLLPDRQKEVIKLRYGLKDGIYRTLEQTAKKMCENDPERKRLTRERIRQIESNALRKLYVILGKEDPKRRKKTETINFYKHLISLGYSKSEIDYAVSKLDLSDVVLLKEFFGDNLDIPLVITSEVSVKRDYVLKTILGIKIPNLIDKFIAEKNSFHIYEEIANGGLYNFYLKRGYNKEEVKKALIFISNEDLEFLKFYFGKNLESKLGKEVTIKEKEKLYKDILNGSLKKALREVRNREFNKTNSEESVSLENTTTTNFNNFKMPGRNNKKVKKK